MASIKKRPDGQWRARYRDAAGKEHARHFARKVDGQRWLDEVTTSVVIGAYVDPRAGRITLASFYRDWATRQLWAPGTVKAMDLAIRSWTFADVELRNLKRSHVEAWVKKMVQDDLAVGTVRTRFNNVRSVLRGAKKDQLLAVDPAEGVNLPRARRAEHSMKIPAPAEVGRILSEADVWFQPFVALCAFGGLRLGEAAAVRLTDIDFLRRTLAVSRQVQRLGAGEVSITLPKYGSERVVHLPDALLLMLTQHVQEIGVHGTDGYLFLGDHGLPPHQNTIGYWWRKTLKAVGIEGIRLHDLRHFYASGLIASGCDVVTVQRALGHSKATTTLNTYSHLWPTAEDRTRAAAGSMMAEALSFETVAAAAR